MKLRTILLALAASFVPVLLSAQVTLPSILTDNMVLQQQSRVKLWGKAAPGKTVTVVTSWDDASYTVQADAAGNWLAVVSTPAAGGPYTVTISDGVPVVLENVLIGEVWVGSGQSNMEMRVADSFRAEQEIADAANYPNIRLLHIDNTTSAVPLDDAAVRHGGWQVASPATVADFSAAAYFFGKELSMNLDVPIGLIETCWGGTLAESWTSAGSLYGIPYFRWDIERVQRLPVSSEERERMFHEDIREWSRQMAQVDKGFEGGEPRWAMTDYNDSAWDEITAPGYVQEQGLEGFSGFLWMRRTVDIPADWAGHELTLDIAAVDDNDFTYFDGVEIGHTEGFFAHRRYTVPASLVKAGKATIAVRVMDTGGLGGIHGDPATMAIIKSDTERIPLAGKWKYRVSLPLMEAPRMPVNTAFEANVPTFLYNAMINPLINYGIRGVIWYQGEANVARAAQYKDLLPLLIHDWREKWGHAFPFYIVQLANHMPVQTGAEESEWAELREAQQYALHLENTGLAVAIDIGEADDIHPRDKYEVGRRLSLLARALTYGEDIPYSGPLYDWFRIEGSRIRVGFRHTDSGLTAAGNAPLEGFYIAGADHIFHKAEAVIDGQTVVVSSPGVSFPVAVRYGWANNPVCNLYNGAGLPAGPFRTDDWPSGLKRY